uniref:BED-type domain-containing protein n=1 Tax=Amphimedon queenslandica TaxID=400682 RepID=A0A1X7UZR2_AMPQE
MLSTVARENEISRVVPIIGSVIGKANIIHDTEDTKFAQCNTCTLKVSRGGISLNDYNTTNLKTHLKSHSSEYAKYDAKCKDDKSVLIPDQPVLKQLSLKESKERSQAWDINDAQAQKVHRRIVDMIALDCQPFSGRGFGIYSFVI